MKYKYTTPGGFQYSPYYLDMIEGNHTLIAGTSGAGKSVLENGIINAILCKYSPFQAQFILIDPKRVELETYRKCPHCLHYADSLPDILDTLHHVRGLIDSRMHEMKRTGRRKSAQCPIYIFIDELVDLVVSEYSKDIIRTLSDSISIARAANIFFVILTQAPNRKILKPEITLNINCRIALRCNSAIESRQIIGENGAESLPAHGLAIVHQDLERYQIRIPLIPDSQLEAIATQSRKNYKKLLFGCIPV